MIENDGFVDIFELIFFSVKKKKRLQQMNQIYKIFFNIRNIFFKI